MKILMLLPVDSQPRLIKRTSSLINCGHEVTVAYQLRDYFKKNHLPDGCDKISLVRIENKKYYKRFSKMFISILKLWKLRKEFDMIYSFSFDLLIISFFLKTKQRFYEIGDLRKINLLFYDQIYKFLLNRQDKIIVTSDKFAEFLHLQYKLSYSKIKVIENKLDSKLFNININSKILNNKEIIVGIIGLLRYPQIIDFLKVISKRKFNIKVYIYGSGIILNEVLRYVDEEVIFYFGEFKYPNDLTKMYSEIDFSFVMYDSKDLNVRLALPNKLYESIYFKKPIIVSKNTFLETKVLKYGIGLSCSIDDIQNLPHKLMEIVNVGGYKKLVDNCLIISDEEIFLNENEDNII